MATTKREDNDIALAVLARARQVASGLGGASTLQQLGLTATSLLTKAREFQLATGDVLARKVAASDDAAEAVAERAAMRVRGTPAQADAARREARADFTMALTAQVEVQRAKDGAELLAKTVDACRAFDVELTRLALDADVDLSSPANVIEDLKDASERDVWNTRGTVALLDHVKARQSIGDDAGVRRLERMMRPSLEAFIRTPKSRLAAPDAPLLVRSNAPGTIDEAFNAAVTLLSIFNAARVDRRPPYLDVGRAVRGLLVEAFAMIVGRSAWSMTEREWTAVSTGAATLPGDWEADPTWTSRLLRPPPTWARGQRLPNAIEAKFNDPRK